MTDTTTPASADPGRDRQSVVYRDGALGRRPAVPTAFGDLERAARRASSKRAWAYVAGGAGEGRTMRNNRRAFDRWAIVPRMAHGITERDRSTTVAGTHLSSPLLLAPIGAGALMAPDSDLAIARAAAATGVPYIFSNQGCNPMEDCAAAMGTGARWFQLYWSSDEDLVDSLLQRAEAIGAGAVVVTLDTTMLGWRPQDLNLGSLPFARGEGIAQYTSDRHFRDIVRRRTDAARDHPTERPDMTLGAIRTLISMTRNHPGRFLDNLRSPVPRAAAETFLDIYSNPGLSWNHLATLRERTRLPIVLKGILHPEDAHRAVELGVDAIVVSNHGGRQIDGSIASLDALTEIRAAIGPNPTILLDSGIRSGSDMFVALALGADAVLLGRPYMYGLAVAGQRGVEEVIRNMLAEFDLTMALAGARSIADIDERFVRPDPSFRES
ncbi:alpha-hydroxy-acid oxidizing protein [Rhodococcus sp. CH91]|uniref:alpha-hydroxy-acid oxidizing protein n=1 Tax=Rhodococcus sp. CH91 TaxID=2910256 RepID=UPI001F4BA9B0|nr:alpha-hydroxy-acid oxidizing protein [Rhodococcus sp. CH91]